jgi:hypothetical protein
MLFRCYCKNSPERIAARRKRFHARILPQTKWHPWFAWRPVSLGNGVCAWLQTIERIRPFEYPSDAEDWMVRRGWGVSWRPRVYRQSGSGCEKP